MENIRDQLRLVLQDGTGESESGIGLPRFGGLEGSSNWTGVALPTDQRLWRSGLPCGNLVGPADLVLQGSRALSRPSPWRCHHCRYNSGNGRVVEPQRGPISLVASEGVKLLGFAVVRPRRAGSLYSVWTRVFWVRRDRDECETLYGVNIEVLWTKLASRVLCFVLLFLGTGCNWSYRT